MKIRALLLPLLLLFPLFVPSHAGAATRGPGDDPAFEDRFMKLTEQLRCLVCQNETLADSSADLAQDLRQEIREKMKQGQSDKQIIDFLVARYGDFVLYRPPVKSTTVMLWAGPFVLLAIGLMVAIFLVRKRGTASATPLTEEQHRRAQALLDEPRKDRGA